MKNNILSLFSMKSAINTPGVKESVDPDSIKQKQSEILKAYKKVFRACNRHGLKLFLQGGTLLGKVRHDGFIPWDDDIDLGLIRRDYDKLKDVFLEELADNFYLQMPGYDKDGGSRFAKIICKDREDIFIDIFPIDYVCGNTVKKNIVGIKSNILMMISGSMEFIRDCSPEQKARLFSSIGGRLNYYVRKSISVIFGFKSVDWWNKVVDDSVRNTKVSYYMTSGLGRWHYFGEIQKRDTFLPLRKTEFCGCNAWTINSPETYLEHNYGANYMEIPPERERESHS